MGDGRIYACIDCGRPLAGRTVGPAEAGRDTEGRPVERRRYLCPRCGKPQTRELHVRRRDPRVSRGGEGRIARGL